MVMFLAILSVALLKTCTRCDPWAFSGDVAEWELHMRAYSDYRSVKYMESCCVLRNQILFCKNPSQCVGSHLFAEGFPIFAFVLAKPERFGCKHKSDAAGLQFFDHDGPVHAVLFGMLV